MKESCEIIRDLLPLYAEDVCSTESKKMVENHLKDCNECNKILETIKKDEKNKNSVEKEAMTGFYNKIKKSKIKAVVISLIVFIIVVLLIKYIYSCILFNNIINKAHKYSDIDNMFIQKMENSLNDEVYVTKKYYKDGKFKEVCQTYTKDNVTTIYTKYILADSDEVITVYPDNRATIEKELPIMNREFMLKSIPFVYNDNIRFRAITPIFLSMKSKNFKVGAYSNENKQCYVLQDRFDIGTNWEIWLDKETGLPIKEININGIKSYYSNNEEKNIDENKIQEYLNQNQDVLINSTDLITEYRYEFNTVTDKDVEIPDLSKYKIERKDS